MALWSLSEASWAPCGPRLAAKTARRLTLGGSWAAPGASWAALGDLWAAPGLLLGGPWAVSGPPRGGFWSHLEHVEWL